MFGVVERSQEGRVVGEEGDDTLQFEETELRVVEVIAGSSEDEILRIETVTEGLPFEVEWRKPGTEILTFLWLKRDSASDGEYYRLISMEGAFVVDGGRLLPVNDTEVSAPFKDAAPDSAANAIRSARDLD